MAPAASTGPGEESAAYLTYDGTLLDSGLQRVGSVSLDDGEAISSVSSDGRLAFSSHREATQNWDCCGPNKQVIYTAAPDGSDMRKLVDGQVDISPDWSPAGEMVAAVGPQEDGQGLEIILIDADTGETVDRIDAPIGAFAWSPDGSQLALASGNISRNEITIYDVHSGKLQRVPETETASSSPIAWGSDGLLVHINRGGGSFVLALVESVDEPPKILRRCSRGASCPLPVDALQT